MKQKNCNYPVLEKEIKHKGIKKKILAKTLGIDEVTLWHKTKGKRSFTIEQAVLIQKLWFPEVPIDILFQHEKKNENTEY